jgi:hypothetical protein
MRMRICGRTSKARVSGGCTHISTALICVYRSPVPGLSLWKNNIQSYLVKRELFRRDLGRDNFVCLFNSISIKSTIVKRDFAISGTVLQVFWRPT